MEKLMGRRTNMVRRSKWKVRRPKHRAVSCCRCGMVGVGCRVLDQIREKEVSVAQLAKLMGRGWVLLRCCLWR